MRIVEHIADKFIVDAYHKRPRSATLIKESAVTGIGVSIIFFSFRENSFAYLFPNEIGKVLIIITTLIRQMKEVNPAKDSGEFTSNAPARKKTPVTTM